MATDEAAIDVEVAYAAGPHQVVRVALRLPAGATLTDAVRGSGVLDGVAAEVVDQLKAGVWGRLAPGGTVLRAGDRVELYRPLTVDPKEARRLRYRRDGGGKKPKRAPQLSGTRSR